MWHIGGAANTLTFKSSVYSAIYFSFCATLDIWAISVILHDPGVKNWLISLSIIQATMFIRL